jgi:hypothetical protein
MSTYQVFVDRPRDDAADAHARLATAMAARYGLPADELEPRLRAGRFRVKANVDRDTAEKFAVDLERLGAEVSIVDASGAPVARGAKPAAAPQPQPAPAPARPTAPPSALPPRASAPAIAAPPAPRNQTATNPPSNQFASGLSAAFGDVVAPAADLGVLGGESGTFSLATLDGKNDQDHAPSGSFAPVDQQAGMPASMGPAIARPNTGQTTPPPRVAQGPLDMFAPPDAETAMEVDVDIADFKPARPKAPSMPPVSAPSAAALNARAAASAAAALPEPIAAAAPAGPSLGDRLRGFAGNTRARMVTGAALTVLIGFAPAAVIASVREGSAFAEIDGHLLERQAQVRNLDDWNTLDRVRDAHHDQKLAEKHSIALESLLIWAALSAGFAFVWFRKIDWDRVAT